MKRFFPVLVCCLLWLSSFAHADSKPDVNQTFQDILHRVESRDKESQAIIRVKGRGHAPSYGLNFSMEEVADHKEVIVTLGINSMTGRIVYEKYRLPIDSAISRELGNQKQMGENEAKRQQKLKEEEQKAQEEQARRIARLTNGVLKMGMSRENIETIKGKPLSVETPPIILPGQQWGGQRHNYFTLIYPDMELKFDWRLRDVKLIKAVPVSPPSASPSSPAT